MNAPMKVPDVTVTISQEALCQLFAGGNYMIEPGDDIGFNVALNALSHAALDLRILGEAVGDTDSKAYNEADLCNRLHWLMHQLESAIELARATKGQKFKAQPEGEVRS